MASTTEIRETLAEGRAEAESLMLATCQITRASDTGPGPLDESTGQYPDIPRDIIYEGKCRLQVKADINSNVVETTAGEREATYLTAQLQVPVAGSEAVRVDDICTIISSDGDADLVGREFNIQGTYHKEQAVYRRFRVREVVQ